MPEAPQTAEGWYVLHDFRDVDWDAWRRAPARERDRAVADGVDYLERHEAVSDVDAEGASGTFGVLGHKADLLFLHFRPTLDDLSRVERAFEATDLARFTTQTHSYVSVTEVSGYVSQDYFEDDEAAVDEGLRRYIEGKLHPDVPDSGYVSFYPMLKRRGEEYNWYDLDFEERAELMSGHGDVGRKYGGKITQVIASSVGFDDWEWGVTLFGDDPTDIKDIVYEMRFDPASSRYGEFGPFFVGQRFPPADLGAYLAGERVPTDGDDAHGEARHRHGESPHGDDAHGGGGGHGHAHEDGESEDAAETLREELSNLGIYAGQPHGEDVYALVVYSEDDAEDLFEEVRGLRANFDHYDNHVKTAVYEAGAASANESDRAAVVSLWKTASAAETAGGFLSDLPGVVRRAGEEEGFGTLGMFYTVKPDHRESFVEKFGEVGDLLSGMDGHRETDLLANVEDENDMFIASRWDSREDAMAFFRSEAFRDTVDWGREVLSDRPRHVFLA